MEFNLIEDLREVLKENIVPKLLVCMKDNNLQEHIIEEKRIKRIKFLLDGTTFMEEIKEKGKVKEWEPLWESYRYDYSGMDNHSIVLLSEIFLIEIEKLEKETNHIKELIKKGKNLNFLYSKKVLTEKINL